MRFRLFHFAIISYIACSHIVLADQIFPAHIGGSFGRSSREPKYKVALHTEDSPFHPDSDQEFIIMPNKSGHKYVCFLPKVEKLKTEKLSMQQNISSMIMETEKLDNLKTPDELLDILNDRCLIRQEGWWSYELCHLKKLRQLHLEDVKVVQEFVLGVYDEEATAAYHRNQSDVSTLKDPRSKDASQRYHTHIYTNGTLCDLTDQRRETEVRFVCAEARTMITSVTELSTCRYAVTVQCPTLCKHPEFQEEKPVWHTIHCNSLPTDYMGSYDEQRSHEITRDDGQHRQEENSRETNIIQGTEHSKFDVVE